MDVLSDIHRIVHDPEQREILEFTRFNVMFIKFEQLFSVP